MISLHYNFDQTPHPSYNEIRPRNSHSSPNQSSHSNKANLLNQFTPIQFSSIQIKPILYIPSLHTTTLTLHSLCTEKKFTPFESKSRQNVPIPRTVQQCLKKSLYPYVALLCRVISFRFTGVSFAGQT